VSKQVTKSLHTDALMRLVEDDVVANLGVFFPATQAHGFQFDAGVAKGKPLYAGEAVAAVAWTYSGEHREEFMGIGATSLPVTIVGMTVVDVSGGEANIRRYVDWHHVLAQLGSVPNRAKPQRT
jgi:hypothetical protein